MASSAAFEVIVLFDQTILLTAYLGESSTCQRSLCLGERTTGGRAPDVTVAAEALGSPGQLQIARWQDGQLWLELPSGALEHGEVSSALDAEPGPDGAIPIEADGPLGALPGVTVLPGGTVTLPLPAGASARFTVAGLTVLVRPTDVPERLPRAQLFAAIDWRESRCTVWSVVGHALLLFVLFSVPREARMAEAFEPMTRQGSMIEVSIKPPVPPPLPPVLTSGEGAGGGLPAPGPEGKAGSKESANTDGAAAIRKRPRQPEAVRLPPKDLRPAQSEARSSASSGAGIDAREAGLLGILRAERATLGSVLSQGSALGDSATDAFGNLQGTTIADARGADGLGLVGTGTGAGCLIDGTCSAVGTGSGFNGRLGRLSGGPGGSGPGMPRGPSTHIGRRQSGTPEPFKTKVTASGGLTAEVIRRIIRRHVNEVKYCYEKELATRPNLFGRVVVSLLISPSGPVVQSSIASTTLANPGSEQCIAAAARRWTFPSSAQATQVTYPFVFQAAGTR